MSRREDRTQRRVVVVRHNRPPAAGRFARRPGPRPDGWRAKLPDALQRPLAWQAPVAGRAVAGAGKAAASAGRSLRDRLRRGLPQTVAGRVLAAVAAIALFTGASWTTTRSALLDVDHIEVSGGALVTPDQATAGAGLRRGLPMVSVDAAAAERRLRHLPWVDTALVERAFPNTVRIHLTERVASAIAARPDGGWVVLDGGGRVLAERPDRPGELPQVIGAGATPVPGHRWPPPARCSTSWPCSPRGSAVSSPMPPSTAKPSRSTRDRGKSASVRRHRSRPRWPR